MLVLTRRTKDKVSFPQVGITIHFLRVQPGQVKVGVDAPREIAILRDDAELHETADFVRRQIAHLPKQVRHGIRNELHEISVGLHLVKELYNANLNTEAEEVFRSLQESLKRLDQNAALRKSSDLIENSDEKQQRVIVLIEDDQNQRMLLAEFLRLKGYLVQEFTDGEPAVDYLLSNDPPSAILVDMNMPNFDGRETVRSLRGTKKFDAVPIYAISGTSPEDNGLPMGRDGVNRWFPKPLSVETLITTLDNTSPATRNQVPA